MSDMSVAPWELVLRAVVVYAVLLFLMRVTGKRTVGQFTPFDLLVVMLLSEAVSNSMSGGDESLWGGLLLAVVLVALNVASAFLSTRSRTAHALLEDGPVLIGRDGRMFTEVLKRQNVPQSDVVQALREADCELAQARCIFLEADGKISVLKRKEQP